MSGFSGALRTYEAGCCIVRSPLLLRTIARDVSRACPDEAWE
jgi:hypothetical protein